MTDQQAPTLPAMEAARTELAALMMPAVEDVLSDLTLPTATFYVEQWAYGLLASYVAITSGAETEEAAVQEQVAQAFQAVAEACGNLDAACALLGLVPPEAADK